MKHRISKATLPAGGPARSVTMAVVVLAMLVAVSPARAQQPVGEKRSLTLAECVAAGGAIERTGRDRPGGRAADAWAVAAGEERILPQVMGSLSYTRTLASEFSSFSSASADRHNDIVGALRFVHAESGAAVAGTRGFARGGGALQVGGESLLCLQQPAVRP